MYSDILRLLSLLVTYGCWDADYTSKTGRKTSATLPISLVIVDCFSHIYYRTCTCVVLFRQTDNSISLTTIAELMLTRKWTLSDAHGMKHQRQTRRRSRVSSLAIPPTMIAAVCGSKYFCMNVVTLNDSTYWCMELLTTVYIVFWYYRI